MAQLYIAPGERETNLKRAQDFIEKTASGGASLVLLPEALPYGWTHPSGREGADTIPAGYDYERLASAARANSVYVCSGLIELDGDRIYNSAVLLDPTGALILHHRKINELTIAHNLYSVGDRLQVVDTPLGRIGMMICADGFAPNQAISRSLAMMGCQFIVSPCAWAVPPSYDNQATPYGKLWLDNYGAVCRDFGIWIAGCSCVGPVSSGAWAGYACIGSSLLLGPNGEIHAKGGFGAAAEELIYADIELQKPHRLSGDTPSEV